jgi:hypothetical protein
VSGTWPPLADTGCIRFSAKVQRSLDAIGGAEPRSTVYSCPLPECEWVHIEPPHEPEGALIGLAAAGYPGLAVWRSLEGHLLAIEGKLRAHLESHTAAEWVPVLVGLQERVAELEGYGPPAREPVTEHAIEMSGGGFHVRNDRWPESRRAQLSNPLPHAGL